MRQAIAALKQVFEEFEVTHFTPPVIATYWELAKSASFQTAAINQGFKVQPLNSLDTLTGQGNSETIPVAWIIDLDKISDKDSITSLGRLNQKNALQNHMPLLFFLTEDADLSKRISASRLGKHTLLQKPVSPEAMLRALKEQLDLAKNTTLTLKRSRILVIDDDESILSALEELQPFPKIFGTGL